MFHFLIDAPKEGEGFFHGIPENFPSLSDLVGEFSENKEDIAHRQITHMINYKTNDDGTITARLQDEKDFDRDYHTKDRNRK